MDNKVWIIGFRDNNEDNDNNNNTANNYDYDDGDDDKNTKQGRFRTLKNILG